MSSTGKILGQGKYGVVSLDKFEDLFESIVCAKKTSPLFKFDYLEKELRILKRFRFTCENIVHCFSDEVELEDFDTEFPKCSIKLEYADGGTLSDVMKNNGGKLPERTVRNYARMILTGLALLHRCGYVHCDLKPDNILAFLIGFDPKNPNCYEVKISDFGLAKEPKESDVKRWMRKYPGTPLYMPPESVGIGGLVSPALDVWSLGCCVLEMLRGTTEWIEDQWKFPENLSAIGRDFLVRCLALDPADRWESELLLNHPFVCTDLGLYGTFGSVAWVPRFDDWIHDFGNVDWVSYGFNLKSLLTMEEEEGKQDKEEWSFKC